MPALIGGVISGVGSLFGGLFGSRSAKEAGDILSNAGNTASTAITNATNNASSTLQPYIGQAQQGVQAATTQGQQGVQAATTQGQQGVQAATAQATTYGNNFLNQLSPYQQAGAQGAQQLSSTLAPGGTINTALNTPFSFNPSDLQNDPGYQFQLKQGLQASQNQMTAAGLGNSGAAVKGANSFATGLAGTYFNNAYQRAQGTYQTNRDTSALQLNALMGMAGLGTTANQQALGATQYLGNAALQGSEYSGNLGMQGAQYSGNLGLQGSEYAGNVGLQGATQMGNWLLGGTEAAQQAYMQGQAGLAAAKMGSGNAWQQALGGITNSISGGLALNQIGSGGAGGIDWPGNSTSFDTTTGQFTYPQPYIPVGPGE